MTGEVPGNGSPGRHDLFEPEASAGLDSGPGLRGVLLQARQIRLIRKELSEILRDRRTIITLVLMPILIYPLLGVAFQQYALASRLTISDERIFRVGTVSPRDYEHFNEQVRLGGEILRARNPDESHLNYNRVSSRDVEEDIKNGLIDVGVRMKHIEPRGQDTEMEFELFYKKDSPTALTLVEYLDRRLSAANGNALRERLGKSHGEKVCYAWAERTAVEVPLSHISIPALIPLILIMMTITGAVYPAIDLTAGERERGTLEILVSAPVPRMGLLFAKYVSVLTVSVFTALLNFSTMLLTIDIIGLGSEFFPNGMSLGLIGEVLSLLLLFAAFFSAVLLAISSFARSFKEAQAYLIPLMLLALGAGVLALLPGLTLDGWLSVAPLVNIVLLARDLFEKAATPVTSGVVVASTVLYALAALAMAARVFGAEGVLYNEQSTWSDLLRRAPEPHPVANLSTALLCLALIFPASFFAQRLIVGRTMGHTVMWGFTIAGERLWLALLSVGLYGLLPLLSAFQGRVRWRSGFRLYGARLPAFLGGVVLGLSLWPLLLQLLASMHRDLSQSIDAHLLAVLLRALREARQQYPIILMGSLAIIAVVEEFFFRGYLFSGLRANGGPVFTILISSALFGFFHVITGGALAVERFVPSTLLGLVLGSIAWWTGSVAPGMLLHAVYNVMLELYGSGIEAAGSPDTVDPSWLAAGAVGTLLGAGLIFLGGGAFRRQPLPMPAAEEAQAV